MKSLLSVLSAHAESGGEPEPRQLRGTGQCQAGRRPDGQAHFESVGSCAAASGQVSRRLQQAQRLRDREGGRESVSPDRFRPGPLPGGEASGQGPPGSSRPGPYLPGPLKPLFERDQDHAQGRADLGDGGPAGAPGSIRCSRHGTGIADTDLERIFNPYSKVGRGESHGLGLGLFISRSIIQAHGEESGPRAGWAPGPRSISLFQAPAEHGRGRPLTEKFPRVNCVRRVG